MISAYDKCSLYLYPQQHDFYLAELSPLILALQETGFISQKIQNDDSHCHFTGEKFLDYIAYMGCAPTIQFEASENKSDFCHVKIHHYDAARLIFNWKQPVSPPCPNCRKPVKDWNKETLAGKQTKIHCHLCNTTSGIEKFNWRKMAGYARLFIEITDIFPKEAIPQQILLDKLSGISKTDWVYFYSCR